MRTYLLQSPWVQVYLLYVAVLFTALIWDRLFNPPATRAGHNQPPRSVLKPRPRSDQEVEPIPGAFRLRTPTDSITVPPQSIAGREPARVRRASVFASHSPLPSLEDLR